MRAMTPSAETGVTLLSSIFTQLEAGETSVTVQALPKRIGSDGLVETVVIGGAHTGAIDDRPLDMVRQTLCP